MLFLNPSTGYGKQKNTFLNSHLPKGKGILCDANSLKSFITIGISIQIKLNLTLNKYY